MSTFKFVPEGWTKETAFFKEKQELENSINNKDILQGIVEKCDENYNLYVKLGTKINGIIPITEVEGINIDEKGLPKRNLCSGKVHKYVQFIVKDLKDSDLAILSRKEVQEEALEKAIYELKPGQTLSGIVKNITKYGAFIEIGGGVVGLAHIEDLSVARIKTPFERLKIGQKVDVVVKYIDKENKKINLSYKEHFGTWEENAQKFKIGETVKGIVRETEKNHNGIFVELTPNLVGMAEYKEGILYGQNIPVYIKKIDYSKKKVKLLFV